MRWMCSLAAFAAVFAFTISSRAAPSARLVYLRNPGAESCPDESSVRSAVSARLGYDPFFPNATETMFIEISRDKGKYRASVKLVDANNDVRGTREIAQVGTSCSGMIDTLALSISIAIDPDSLTRAPGTPPVADSPPPPLAVATEPVVAVPEAPPAPTPDRVPDDQQPSSSKSAARFELWIAPALWFGAGASVAFGGELGARARWPYFSVGLSARGDAPASRTVDGVDVSFAFIGGGVAACGHLDVLSACALGTFGRLSATSNASKAQDDSTARLLLGASVGAELPVGDTIRPFARAIVNEGIGNEQVTLGGVNVYELPHLSVGFELGSAIRF